MRKIVCLLVLVVIGVNGRAQPGNTLAQRTDSMLRLTRMIDLERVMDYTYPKVFTIAPRAQLIAAMETVFENEEFKATIDSVQLVRIHPVFTHKDGQYAMINYTMLLKMKFNEVLNDEQSSAMVAGMEESFGKGNIRYEKSSNSMIAFMNSWMVAIKDDASRDWTFLNYKEDDPLAAALIDSEVLEKLKTYK